MTSKSKLVIAIKRVVASVKYFTIWISNQFSLALALFSYNSIV